MNIFTGYEHPCTNCSVAPVASHLKGLHSFSNSAVKVPDSQAYRNMEMTRELVDFTFDQRDTLLTLHIGFRFVRDAVACAILERTEGFKHLVQEIWCCLFRLASAL